MKRFHAHVSVADLQEGIRFYSAVFGTAPAVERPDYAKWMLDDPRVNFAISQRGRPPGLNHFGIQVESSEELERLRGQFEAADSKVIEQTGASCCYVRSDKYWVTDPAGVPWESFHTLDSVPVYGEDAQAAPQGREAAEGVACCRPAAGEDRAAPASAEDGAGRKACCA